MLEEQVTHLPSDIVPLDASNVHQYRAFTIDDPQVHFPYPLRHDSPDYGQVVVDALRPEDQPMPSIETVEDNGLYGEFIPQHFQITLAN